MLIDILNIKFDTLRSEIKHFRAANHVQVSLCLYPVKDAGEQPMKHKCASVCL
jgi:hypothetical protein